MWENKNVRVLSGGGRVVVDDRVYISMHDHNFAMIEAANKELELCNAIEDLSKENRSLRILLGLPEEGPLGMNVENTETFFDDSEKEAKDEEICEWDLKSDGTSRTTCGKWVGEIMSSHNFDHCPYCGKKVKRLYMADELLNYEPKEE